MCCGCSVLLGRMAVASHEPCLLSDPWMRCPVGRASTCPCMGIPLWLLQLRCRLLLLCCGGSIVALCVAPPLALLPSCTSIDTGAAAFGSKLSSLCAQGCRALRSSAASATSRRSRQLWRRCRFTRPPVRASVASWDGMLHIRLVSSGALLVGRRLCCRALPAHECRLALFATTLQASCRTLSTSHPSQPTPRPRRAARSARYRAPQVRQLSGPPADAWFTECCCGFELDAALSRWLAAAALHGCRGRGAGGCSAGQRAHCACCQGGTSSGSGG